MTRKKISASDNTLKTKTGQKARLLATFSTNNNGRPHIGVIQDKDGNYIPTSWGDEGEGDHPLELSVEVDFDFSTLPAWGDDYITYQNGNWFTSSGELIPSSHSPIGQFPDELTIHNPNKKTKQNETKKQI